MKAKGLTNAGILLLACMTFLGLLACGFGVTQGPVETPIEPADIPQASVEEVPSDILVPNESEMPAESVDVPEDGDRFNVIGLGEEVDGGCVNESISSF